MKYSKLLIGIITLVITLVFGATSQLHAQGFDESGLAVKPAIIDINGTPGETITKSITLQNISRDPLGIEVGSRGLIPNDPEIDQSRRSDFDASLWITPVQSATVLDGGQQKDIAINIAIPESASPGGHYALITFRAASVTAAEEAPASSTKTNTEVTTVALITVPGEVDEQAEIALRGFPSIIFNDEQEINLLFYNTGNIHTLPRTRVTVHTHSGDILETLSIPPELVLPNTIKTLSKIWDPEGVYGRFYIEITADFGTPNQSLTVRSDTIWVLPPLPTLLLWGSLAFAVLFTAFTVWRWPDAARKAAGHPIRFVRRKTLREAREDQTVNLQKTLKKVSVADPALDELGKERSIPSTKTRAIDGVLPGPKRVDKPNILNDTQRTSQDDYLKKIQPKESPVNTKIRQQIKERIQKTTKK